MSLAHTGFELVNKNKWGQIPIVCKFVAVGGLVADGINFYVNSKSAGLWGFGAGVALQTVSPAFRAMPEWASSRAAAGVFFGIEKGIEKGVENTYEKK